MPHLLSKKKLNLTYLWTAEEEQLSPFASSLDRVQLALPWTRILDTAEFQWWTSVRVRHITWPTTWHHLLWWVDAYNGWLWAYQQRLTLVLDACKESCKMIYLWCPEGHVSVWYSCKEYVYDFLPKLPWHRPKHSNCNYTKRIPKLSWNHDVVSIG